MRVIVFTAGTAGAVSDVSTVENRHVVSPAIAASMRFSPPAKFVLDLTILSGCAQPLAGRDKLVKCNGEFTQFVAYHVFRHKYRNDFFSIVYGQSDTDHFRDNG